MNRISKELIEKSYALACERYALMGVDCDDVVEKMKDISISIHCWQGDDVRGFEKKDASCDGGILSTGRYPGRAADIEQLRSDLEKVYSLLPGKHRLNLHAIYADTNGRSIERNNLRPEHFQSWIEWAKKLDIGIDFNPSFFSHPMASSGLTLSHPDEKIRRFWIEHAMACRNIAQYIGKELQSPCVMNIWIPDGSKDVPVDRKGSRERLKNSLDEIYSYTLDEKYIKDSLESKLFGIGLESFTVGSHEFYMLYASENNKMLCLDTGHFHPTEMVSDKISSTLQFMDELLLHVSRPVRWDSDHVVIFDEELQAIAQELVRGDFIDRVHIGLDFFDATINRLAAWSIGSRNILKSICKAMLEPKDFLQKAEKAGDYTTRLAMLEELKMMPFAAVWDYYCLKSRVEVGIDWLSQIKDYEKKFLINR